MDIAPPEENPETDTPVGSTFLIEPDDRFKVVEIILS